MPTLQEVQNWASHPNMRAFLDAVAWAEGGQYNVLYGGGKFSDLSRHPNRMITAGGYSSTAAGRYQFLYRTWVGIQKALGLPDFSPQSQDIGAVYLIWQKGAINDIIVADNPVAALKKFGCLWAALPYATCKQKMRSLNDFLRVYQKGKGSPTTTPTSTPNSTPIITGNNLPILPTKTSKNTEIAIAIGILAGGLLLLQLSKK